MDDLRRYAEASTGWVIMVQDLADGESFPVIMKDHGAGYVAETRPLLVIDCYEHSYCAQYGIDKEGYLDAFFRNVDWDAVFGRAQG